MKLTWSLSRKSPGTEKGCGQKCLHHRAVLERMQRICDLVQSGTYPNSLTLARDLEVSQATVKRDIEFLRDRLALPIEYDALRHGYYLSRPIDGGLVAGLGPFEAFALKVAHKVVAQYPGTTLAQPLDRSFRKFAAQLAPLERQRLEHCARAFCFRSFAPDELPPAVFELVTRAVAQHRALAFEYRKPGERGIELRRVHPYQVVAFDHRWYLLGFDVARQAIRKFVLSRMRKARLLPNESFEPPEGFEAEEYLSSGLGIMTGSADYEVALELDCWLTGVLRGRRWHPSQVWVELPGGSSYLRLRLSCLEEIQQCVLGWGPHVTVLRPLALAQRVAKAAQELVTKYSWVALE